MKKVSFDANTAKKLVRNSKFIDNQPRSLAEDSTPSTPFAGLFVLRSTTQISGLSGKTPGTGQGILQNLINNTYSDASTVAYPILNNNSASIASNAFVLCGRAFGKFIVIDTSCANVTQH